jgi:TonB family protein
MKRSLVRGLGPFSFVLMLSFLSVLPARVWSDDLADQLKSDYAGKVLTLRHFYAGTHLSFESDGSLVGSAKEGPWTVDGQVSVNSVRVHERTLRISARRILMVLDSKSKLLRDELSLLEESNTKDKNDLALEKTLREDLVEIDITLTSANPNEQDVSAAMNPVFLAPGESARDIVPDFWRGYFDQIEGKTSADEDFMEKVYKAKPGEVAGPRVLKQVDPEFSEASRKAKYQGTMEVSLVVDRSGSVQNIRITSPLGMGLDEKKVEAVRQWKFQPGMKDGEPVAVKIAVEMDFHLY